MPEHLYIFVNGCVFDASNGVKEFMNRGEIAGLVGIARASAVVHLEARIEPKDLRIDAVPSRDVQHSGVRVTHLPNRFGITHFVKSLRHISAGLRIPPLLVSEQERQDRRLSTAQFKVFVLLFCRAPVTRNDITTSQLQLLKRSEWIVRHKAMMINELLEFRCRFLALP